MEKPCNRGYRALELQLLWSGSGTCSLQSQNSQKRNKGYRTLHLLRTEDEKARNPKEASQVKTVVAQEARAARVIEKRCTQEVQAEHGLQDGYLAGKNTLGIAVSSRMRRTAFSGHTCRAGVTVFVGVALRFVPRSAMPEFCLLEEASFLKNCRGGSNSRLSCRAEPIRLALAGSVQVHAFSRLGFQISFLI